MISFSIQIDSPYANCLDLQVSMKVDQASLIDTHTAQATVSTTSSASSSKFTMFGVKSGFVIPKNKLSGSLVPILRDVKKSGGSDAVDEENTKQVQRKTKWAPDLTQDPSVRKGRAIAYQTRVDQITQQLKTGILGIGDNEGSSLAAPVFDQEYSGFEINNEKLKLLELERREVIGEILKLNPSYKAPPDYRPILKEARVPIPVKEYKGYDFIGLIFGPGGDTVKRLEKETGAKVQVYGTKAVTGEKGEVTLSDANDNPSAYEELYFLVSADTFEKVDATVALIELLITSISANTSSVSTSPTSVSADGTNVLNQRQDSATPYLSPPALNQGSVHPLTGLSQNPAVQGQYLPHSSPWNSTAPLHASIQTSSGFNTLPTSAPNLNTPVHSSAFPFIPSNTPSLSGLPPASATVFVPPFPNQSFVPPSSQPSMQALQRPYIPLGGTPSHNNAPRNFMSGPQPPRVQSNTPGAFGNSPSAPNGLPLISRPLMPSFPSFTSNLPQGMPGDRPLTPSGSSSGWSTGPVGIPASLRSNNAMQMPPPLAKPPGSHPVPMKPIVASRAPPNPVQPSLFPFQPSGTQSLGSSVNQPVVPPKPVPGSTTVPVQMRASFSVTPMTEKYAGSSVPNPSQIPSPTASTSAPPAHSVSGTIPSFTPLKPFSVTAPRPQHPSSGDFTFQPLHTQNPVSQASLRPSSQPAAQGTAPKPMVQHPTALQVQSFQTAMSNSGSQVFPRTLVGNQLGQPQTNTIASSIRPRLPIFPMLQSSPIPQLGVRNSSPALPMPNMTSPFPPRPENSVQLQQNYHASGVRPETILASNQQSSSNPSFAPARPASGPSGGQQIYDPFSPTSVSHVQQQGANLSQARKQENDPEYEDLMASVGVR